MKEFVYEAPQVEIVEVAVEKGYMLSGVEASEISYDPYGNPIL